MAASKKPPEFKDYRASSSATRGTQEGYMERRRAYLKDKRAYDKQAAAKPVAKKQPGTATPVAPMTPKPGIPTIGAAPAPAPAAPAPAPVRAATGGPTIVKATPKANSPFKANPDRDRNARFNSLVSMQQTKPFWGA